MNLTESSKPKAGRNVRQLAARRTTKALVLSFLSISLAVLAVLLLFFSPIAVLLAAPLVYLSIHIGVRLNQQSELVYQARRGAQAEECVGQKLEELQGWQIFHNIQLPELGDIDHLAVGPGGVVMVETKSQRGQLVTSRGRLGFRQPLGTRWIRRDLIAQTRKLEDLLRQRQVPVTSFLCFPFAQVEAKRIKGIHLVNLQGLIEAIEKLPVQFTGEQIDQFCQTLPGLAGTT